MITNFTHYNNDDYLTVIENSKVLVYKLPCPKPIQQYHFSQNINGAAFVFGRLFFSLENNGGSFGYMKDDNAYEISLKENFVYVKILKLALDGDKIYIVYWGKDINNESYYAIYDLEGDSYSKLPMCSCLKDISFCKKNTVIELVNYKVPAQYMDDDENMTYRVIVWNKDKLWRDLGYQYCKNELDASIAIWSEEDWWSGNYYARELSSCTHYALFDYYLYSWPRELCISNRGNSYLTYNEDFNGIIVSDIEGRVVLCFRLPGDYTVKDRYYYNEKKQYLYIIKDCELYVYSIQQEDKLIDEMNKRYYMAECGRKSLQNDLEFEELFHEVLDTAECKLMLNIKLV